MKSNLKQPGFTLLEIIIAVMILAMSLTTLLSLQTSSVSQALKTRNALEAMLVSRAIMAAIEFNGSSLLPTNRQGTATEIASIYLSPEALAPISAKQAIIPLQASLIIEPWNLPKIKENSLLKVTLTVSWSNQPQDQITTYYFVARELDEEN